VDLDSVADELYSLPPEDFVARRGALEKQARKAGNRDLAGQIRRLGKPTAVAWLANQLVREHPDEIAPLLELGAGLRDATANLSGDELRRLSQQQHQVIQALIRQAGAISGVAGHDLSDATARGLEDTLRAALADGDLADELASARLTTALEHVGFGVTVPGRPSGRPPSPPAKPEAPRPTPTDDDRRAARIERLARDAQEAQAASDAAAAAHESAQQAADQSAAQTRARAQTMNRLQQELDDAVRAHARSEREERQARAAAADSARAAQRARRRLDEVTASLDAAKKG
jgi:flagellar biosynthesis GTPase FlhF